MSFSINTDNKMHIEKIECKDSVVLLSKLKGQVFHVTSQEAYSQIIADGEISNNKSGRFQLNTGSKNSFGHFHGYVCLFDLRNDTQEIVEKSLHCGYEYLGPRWFEKYSGNVSQLDLVYLLLNSEYYEHVIPNSVGLDYNKNAVKALQLIPDYEVWVEDHVPLGWIHTSLIVTIKLQTFDLSASAGRSAKAVCDAHRV